MRNYLQKNIDLRKQLKKYRDDINERFPDPSKAAAQEEVSPTKGKKADPKDAKKSALASKEPTKEPESGAEDKLEPESSVMDIDSVIDDTDLPDFTAEMKYMRGADLAPEIIATFEEPPKKAEYLSNVSAKKTAYQTTYLFKDFEYKKDDLMKILQRQKEAKNEEFRVRTKGKFAEHIAQAPGENFVKDISWIKKANPLAASMEKNFHDRDLFLLEKRRFQKVIQCIQLEEQFGMAGVTRIPEKYKDKIKPSSKQQKKRPGLGN